MSGATNGPRDARDAPDTGAARDAASPPPPPRLGPRLRTDPALTLAKLKDVLSPHCGIVLDVQRLGARDPTMHGLHAYWSNVETATLLGNAFLRGKRGREPEAWRHAAQGRNGSRVAYDRTRAFVRTVGEALERYACCVYDPSGFVTAPWRDVREAALDPRACQMPSAEEYGWMRPFQPFDPDAPMRWAWGWSLRDRKRTLVPAQLAWVMYNAIPGEPLTQPGSSTGWALHHTPEEAIHTALREVVERDAFMLMWLCRMPAPLVDLDALTDPDSTRFRDAMRREGVELQARSTTTDLGIPAFAVFLIDRRAGRPAFLVTTAAHPDPVRGLRQALEEAAMTHVDKVAQVRAMAAAGALDAPVTMEEVATLGNHAEYYFRQESLRHLEWMIGPGPGPTLRLDDLPDLSSPTGDAWEETQAMVERIARAGYDTLYVDTTPPDLRETGWSAAKVLVPGTVRHEYGFGARLLDAPRIFDAPVRMGRRDRPLAPHEVNPDAHPYS